MTSESYHAEMFVLYDQFSDVCQLPADSCCKGLKLEQYLVSAPITRRSRVPERFLQPVSTPFIASRIIDERCALERHERYIAINPHSVTSTLFNTAVYNM